MYNAETARLDKAIKIATALYTAGARSDLKLPYDTWEAATKAARTYSPSPATKEVVMKLLKFAETIGGEHDNEVEGSVQQGEGNAGSR